jgi:hypothetical protein
LACFERGWWISWLAGITTSTDRNGVNTSSPIQR